MNLSYINDIGKRQADKLGVYELSQLIQYKLLFTLCNFSVKEVRQLERVLQEYKNERFTLAGVPPEPAVPVEHRLEVVAAQCALANSNAED